MSNSKLVQTPVSPRFRLERVIDLFNTQIYPVKSCAEALRVVRASEASTRELFDLKVYDEISHEWIQWTDEQGNDFNSVLRSTD